MGSQEKSEGSQEHCYNRKAENKDLFKVSLVCFILNYHLFLPLKKKDFYLVLSRKSICTIQGEKYSLVKLVKTSRHMESVQRVGRKTSF